MCAGCSLSPGVTRSVDRAQPRRPCANPSMSRNWRCRDQGLDASSKVSLGRGRKPGDGIRLNGSSSFGNRILVEWRQKHALIADAGAHGPA